MGRSCHASLPQGGDRGGQRIPKHPHVTRIAAKVEALLVERYADLGGRYKATQCFLVLPGSRNRLLDRLQKFRMVELAGDAKRYRQVEMADPQAVDAIDGGNPVGIFGAFGSL